MRSARARATRTAAQYDEYGDGDPNRLHHHLFARGLVAVGLRSEYGAYVDDALTETLELNNAVSMFGLHRRLRGAAMGHLGASPRRAKSRALRMGRAGGRL